MKRLNKRCLMPVLLWVVLAGISTTFARPVLPPVISSHMVLQQERECPIWGTADPGESIRVSFAGQTLSTQADALGRWAVILAPMKADKTPRTLTVQGKDEALQLTDVMVGEVWLCSGQSNMQYSLRRFRTFAAPKRGRDLGEEELKKPENPMIRVFLSDRAQSWNSWQRASGESLPDITAAGYFFGKDISQSLDVPVGIISAALGGQRIETWTSVAAYRADAIFKKELERTSKISGLVPSQWYNHLIMPVCPFAVRGFLWYQGENNCVVRERNYAAKFKVLVESWRKAFRVPDAPFYSVLLAPHTYSAGKGEKKLAPDELPLFWMQQLKGVSLVPNNDIVCISDLVDDPMDIHPPYKWEVGARLARLALARTYGKVEGTVVGPHLVGVESKKHKLVLRFDQCGKGLKSRDGKPLDWFEVAGTDNRFYPARAEIKGKDKVVVECDSVSTPVSARFGWNENAMPNLINSDNLPAFPFGKHEAKEPK